jgi:hypothetical protein
MNEKLPARDDQIRRVLGPDEKVHAKARSTDGLIAVTDRRLIVAADNRVALDVAIDRIRRIQFDIERARPATLVIVPEHPRDEPQVLSIPPEEYAAAAHALTIVGERLADAS